MVRKADLTESLDFVADGEMDKVLCALALDYIRDWDAMFAEFTQVLKLVGQLVFSVHHPFFMDLKVEVVVWEDYLSVQEVDEDWLVFGLQIPAYRRSPQYMSAS